MSLSGVFAQVVALVGDAAILWRRLQGSVQQQAVGATPTIPAATAARPHPDAEDADGPGLGGGADAGCGARSARSMRSPPASSIRAGSTCCPMATSRSPRRCSCPDPSSRVFDYAMVSTMKRAAAVGVSPNRITLLRDADGDGVAETREAFLEGLSQPFGMALLGDTFYVGNTDGVVAFPYTSGATRITAPGRKLTAFKPGGHWTRSLLPSPDGRKLYVGVGSLSNIGDAGMEVEEGRACIYELDLASRRQPHLRLRPAQPGGPGLGAAHAACCGPWSTSATASATRRRPTT